MLNEGVHAKDVNGVILLRPTISPIIFKQQIGQALCKYKEENGNLEIAARYDTEEGFAPGKWIRRHQERRANGTTAIKLIQERQQRMEAIGMVRKA